MLKKILVFLIGFFMIYSIGSASENDRWQWVDSNARYSVYIDKETVSSARMDKVVTYWTKTTDLEGNQMIRNITLFRIPVQYKISYEKEMDANGRTISESYGDGKTYPIYPDTFHEKTANAACRLLKLSSVFKATTHQWKWFYSSAESKYYICTDTSILNREKGTFTVFVKYNYGLRTWYMSYDVDFRNKAVISNGQRKFLVPESFEEALYRVADKIT